MATKNGGIDKEQMFKKIMPSAATAPSTNPPNEGKSNPSPPAVQPPSPAQQNIESPPPEAALSEALKDVAIKAASQPSTFAEDAPPRPVNLAELLVEKSYPIYRTRLDGCECQRCRDDVCGMTLNKITPRYIPSNLTSETELANRQLVTETVTALIRSIFLVKLSPHHGNTHSIRT